MSDYTGRSLAAVSSWHRNVYESYDEDPYCEGCEERDAEIERLRAENERYYLLFTKLQDIAGDRRFSDQFVGSATRHRLNEFAAATKEAGDE